MRIVSIQVRDTPPIKLFEVTDLADIVVFAGPNGVGKTSLIQAIIQVFRSPHGQKNMRLEVEATNPTEHKVWGKNKLDTSDLEDAKRLATTLQGTRRRTNWKSSVIQFESDRTIQKIEPFSFTWNFGDPWEEQYGWDQTFTGLRSRFQDTIHSIFRKVQGRRDKIGRAVEEALRLGSVTVQPNEYPDPLTRFKDAFAQLLAPKQLLDPDPKEQQLYYSIDGKKFPLTTLSSGEREVVNIVFDFLLRNPEDCVVFFDEPELHLHPELSYKLLQTLRAAGTNNQFIFCTHSSDIITASIDNSVVFVSPVKDPVVNQAVTVREDDETNHALRLLGYSVGIIALGKRLVLIEGTSASVDKQLYGTLLRNAYPGLVLVPSGGKGVITSFAALNRGVLEKTLWGVEFFMLCDRDVVPLSRPVEQLERESNRRLRVLSRYHIENYFLDTRVLAKVFEQMEPEESWLRSSQAIEVKLREIARSCISYAVALVVAAEFRDRVGNLDIMPSAVHGKNIDDLVPLILSQLSSERKRIDNAIGEAGVESRIRALFHDFESSLVEQGDRWKIIFPGKTILAKFAGLVRHDLSRLKTMYIQAAEGLDQSPFIEIQEIFDGFVNFKSS